MLRWRAPVLGEASAVERVSDDQTLAAHSTNPHRRRVSYRRNAVSCLVIALSFVGCLSALLLGFLELGGASWLRGMAYGGLVGRSWTWGSIGQVAKALPRLAASNLAGLEEEVRTLVDPFHSEFNRIAQRCSSCTKYHLTF
jgi:hypothetical protein